MLRLAMILSFFLAAPALADGVWLKGRNDQIWLERVAVDGPEHNTRHGFTRVARTERPVVYLDADRVEWNRRGSSSSAPVVVVRHDGRRDRRHNRHYSGSHPHHRSTYYGGQRRHGYLSYSYPRYGSDGYRNHRGGHYDYGSHRGRHYRGTRHGRIRHHRGGHKIRQARGLGRRHSRGFRR